MHRSSVLKWSNELSCLNSIPSLIKIDSPPPLQLRHMELETCLSLGHQSLHLCWMAVLERPVFWTVRFQMTGPNQTYSLKDRSLTVLDRLTKPKQTCLTGKPPDANTIGIA
ncbi:hypothetical protein BpHYR1_012501 [Brachionus plicatilis]|uniref:Uncharacterized protein n=1 Tax=Brachionus plicatilis TaxID=10195 RepID=A0A3M7SW29_BRAPC|nr:hypothetical protein BpHYR1_012501 [Brachionus plicatilis]